MSLSASTRKEDKFAGTNCFGLTWYFINEYELSNYQRVLGFGRLNIECLIPQFGFVLEHLKSVTQIYTFNDNPISVQYLFSKISCDNISYIEDGTAPYNSHYISRGIVASLVKSLIFGHFYDWCSVLGTSKYIATGVFTSKELIRSENKRYRSTDYALHADTLKIIQDISNHLDIKLNVPAGKKNALILLPNLTNTSSNVMLNKDFKKMISALNDLGWNVFLKLHPLDTISSGEFCFEGCTILPQYIPAEILPCLISPLELVVGLQTTSLASMKFIFSKKDIAICAIRRDAHETDEALLHDVIICNGVSEVLRAI